MKIKICGLSDSENISGIASLKPSMMGFIFYAPSPRNACALMPDVVKNIPEGIERVGVFVDAPVPHILHTAQRYGLTTVQLHGHESPDDCRQLRLSGLKVMKGIGIDDNVDWDSLKCYEDAIDLFIFDTLTAIHGGSGRKFNWSLLKSYPLTTHFLLSGGIGPDDIDKVYNASTSLHLMDGIDINSRFESSPGNKDINLVKNFIEKLRIS